MRLDYGFLDRFHGLGAEPGHEFGLPPSAKLAMLVRPAFVARKGKTFVWCDWSAIEARMLPWLAGSRSAERTLDIFRTNDADPSLPDVYEINAGQLLDKDPKDVTPDERQSHGKVPVLSLGFGGGIGALQNMANNYRVYLDNAMAERMVEGWREANPWARNFWGAHNKNGSYGLWGAACSAMEEPGVPQPVGRVAYIYEPDYLGGSLICGLPSGRLLTYPRCRWERREVEDKKTKQVVERTQLTFSKGYGRSALWYGKLAENVTQAEAASLLRQTLVALRAEEDWMPVVGHTHDEAMTEPDENDAEDAAAVLHEYFTDGFPWSEGLPLAAETTIAPYYSKSKFIMPMDG